jgi:isopenicillin N synthase-like dioxygenase
MAAHYYPYCPQPDLTVGIMSHTDPGVLTVLLQDQIGGLQVKHGEGWVDVKPVPGAIVINVGDIMQVGTSNQ